MKDMNQHKAITSRLNSLVGITKPKGRNTLKNEQNYGKESDTAYVTAGRKV